MKFWGVRAGSILAAFAFCFALEAVSSHQNSFVQRLIFLAGLYVTLAVSLNLINGITGQFSIGHAAFYQVGAYTTGFLASKYFNSSHMSPVLWIMVMMVLSAIAASVAGLVVGLPSLRLKGDYLAIVTLGFGEIIRIIAENQKSLGGSYGMPVAPRFQFIWLAWLLAILCIAVCRNLLKTAHGLPFLAVRDDEVASSAMGVSVTSVKLTAFLLGSAFAGAAGALYAHGNGFIGPDQFRMDVSFIIVTMVVLGGTGSITGTAIAAVLLFYLPEKMRDLHAVGMGYLAATAVFIVLGVVAFNYLRTSYFGVAKLRYAIGFCILAGTIIGTAVLGRGLGYIPALQGNVDGANLRFVVFAVTLIVLMLLRPDGMLGHHEFSWAWVQKLTGKQSPETEIAA